jgi:hypothetical protein
MGFFGDLGEAVLYGESSKSQTFRIKQEQKEYVASSKRNQHWYEMAGYYAGWALVGVAGLVIVWRKS